MTLSTVQIPKKSGATDGNYVYRSDVADAAVAWFPKYIRHVEGRMVGQPFALRPWQADYVKALYGWRHRSNEDLMRYRRGFLEVSRGNGKSMSAAALGLKGLIGDGVSAPSVIGAATDRASAGIVFSYGARAVRAEPELSKRLKVIDSVKRIVRKSGTGTYHVLSSEAPRAHGYHPTRIVFDELHTQPDRELYDVLATSQITVDNPFNLSITTAGYDRHSICWEVHQEALQACQNPEAYPDLLAAVYAAEDGDDIEDPKVMLKANPNLGVSVMESDLRAQIAKAKHNPAFMNAVMRLHFNIWTSSDVRWMPMREWDACSGIVDEIELKGRPCFAGLDLAQVSDLTALALVFPPDDDRDDDGIYDVLVRFWAPEDTIAQNPLYQDFHRRGLLRATPGKATDFAFIREEIFKLASTYRIQELAYDRFYAAQLSQELEQEGIQVVPFGQGFASMSGPTKELMRLVLDKRIRHGGHACLRWNADNLVVQQDPAGNVKPNKVKSGSKIDGMTAVIMAIGRATADDVGIPGIISIGGAA